MNARLGLLALCAVVAFACSETTTVPPTAVIVTIDAGPAVRERIETLTVAISRGRTPADLDPHGDEVFEIGEFHWPASLTLVATASDVHAFGVAVTAETSTETLVVVRAISEFLEHKTLLLEMYLPDECVGYLDCDEEQTCRVIDGRPECGTARLARLPELDQGDLARLREGDPDAGSGDAGPRANEDSGTQDAGSQDSGPRDLGDANMPTDSGMPPEDSGTPPEDSGTPLPEDCWNGMDDDGDGDIDCADGECVDRATCAPAGSTIGVRVDAAANCPAGYTEAEKGIYTILTPGGCTGCSCSNSGPTSCTTDVYFYTAMSACTADTGRTGGTKVGTVSTGSACVGNPIGEEEGIYTPAGWRVSAFSTTPGPCAASGTPTLEPNDWMNRKKLCITAQVGGGCEAGLSCVPATTEPLCGTQTSGVPCPTGSTGSAWFDGGVNDTRQCGACECSSSGGSCGSVLAEMGSDWVCGASPKTLASGGQDCSANNYSPPVGMIGTPTPSTCTPRSVVSGTATPTGPVNLCCTL